MSLYMSHFTFVSVEFIQIKFLGLRLCAFVILIDIISKFIHSVSPYIMLILCLSTVLKFSINQLI